MIVDVDLQVRPAVLTDQRQIANLIQVSSHVHRHLDWRSPLDWIGSPPFFVIESQGQIIAALGCPPEPPSLRIRIRPAGRSRSSWMTIRSSKASLNFSTSGDTARPLSFM